MTAPTPNVDPFSEEAINNDDIDMDSAELGRMEHHVGAAMGDPRIKAAFDKYEVRANRYKLWHTWVGTFSLALLIVALVFGLLRLTGEAFGFAAALQPFTTTALVLGSIPFVCAAGLWLFGVHEHWVLSRFRAERIRHWKFQQLLDGDYIEHIEASPATARTSFEEQWGFLMTDLAQDAKQMDKYVNSTPFRSKFVYGNMAERAYADPEIFRSAATVFFNARLRFQRRWFVWKSGRYQKSDRWTKRVANWLLSLSVLTAFGEGVLHFGAPYGTRSTTVWRWQR